MNEDELREALVRERVRNAYLEDLVRKHWNEIVRLREANAQLHETVSRMTQNNQ